MSPERQAEIRRYAARILVLVEEVVDLAETGEYVNVECGRVEECARQILELVKDE